MVDMLRLADIPRRIERAWPPERLKYPQRRES
jgi:hypothetical protein